MIVGPDPREIITQFAGCKDIEDAKAKAEASYHVIKFKTVEEVKEKKK